MLPLEMSKPGKFRIPSSGTSGLHADAIVERVRRGAATSAERLSVAALDEMPDEDGPDAVRATCPRPCSGTQSAHRRARRWSSHVGIVEALADEADRGRGGETMHRPAAGR